MAALWILIFVLELSRRATCDYECTIQTTEVACSGINSEQLSQKVSATLNKTDIVILNLTNGIVPTISPTTFKDFTSLQTLYVTDCEVSNLEDNAFSHSLDLQKLYLNNNTLTKFNGLALPPENGLTLLDLSYNLLNDLSDFNLSYFPKLNVLNLANNFLSYLPVSILTKLEEQNQFYLVADNNPWNCEDPNWSEYLTEQIINAFCKHETSTPNVETQSNTQVVETTNLQASDTAGIIITERDSVTNSLQPLVDEQNFNETSRKSENDEIKDKECEKPNCAKCSFYFCLCWFVGGIWIGIILGNIGKIKDLVCSRSVLYTDNSTQCDYAVSDQYMVSGYHLDFLRKVKNTDKKTKNKGVNT